MAATSYRISYSGRCSRLDINDHPAYLNAASRSRVRSISLNCRNFSKLLTAAAEMPEEIRRDENLAEYDDDLSARGWKTERLINNEDGFLRKLSIKIDDRTRAILLARACIGTEMLFLLLVAASIERQRN